MKSEHCEEKLNFAEKKWVGKGEGDEHREG